MTKTKQLNEDILILKKEHEESRKEIDIILKETSIEIKETSRQMKETDKKLDRIGKMVGSISNNQGDVAEEFFYNTISEKKMVGNIHYDFTDKNVTRKRDNIEDEFDIIMVNGRDVAIIETKYKAHLNDLERLLNKKYVNFKKLYPEYREYKHHLGLASFYITDTVKDEALNNNVMILQRKGDLIETFLP